MLPILWHVTFKNTRMLVFSDRQDSNLDIRNLRKLEMQSFTRIGFFYVNVNKQSAPTKTKQKKQPFFSSRGLANGGAFFLKLLLSRWLFFIPFYQLLSLLAPKNRLSPTSGPHFGAGLQLCFQSPNPRLLSFNITLG